MILRDVEALDAPNSFYLSFMYATMGNIYWLLSLARTLFSCLVVYKFIHVTVKEWI